MAEFLSAFGGGKDIRNTAGFAAKRSGITPFFHSLWKMVFPAARLRAIRRLLRRSAFVDAPLGGEMAEHSLCRFAFMCHLSWNTGLTRFPFFLRCASGHSFAAQRISAIRPKYREAARQLLLNNTLKSPPRASLLLPDLK
ncbi:hypothetical protein [Celeribacter sp.]|uniref:hypothetical protein n=1 Tax=Celeribacter sp. TaxID=1890673 RepID=UPI003A8F9869